jgi:hypothetical protein
MLLPLAVAVAVAVALEGAVAAALFFKVGLHLQQQ